MQDDVVMEQVVMEHSHAILGGGSRVCRPLTNVDAREKRLWPYIFVLEEHATGFNTSSAGSKEH